MQEKKWEGDKNGILKNQLNTKEGSNWGNDEQKV